MQTVDTLTRPKGRWRMDFYEGEVERVPLTPEQRRENEAFRRARPAAPYPLHAGAIVSRSIDAYEGTNLVTTVGKNLYLDRLFAMAGTPTQVNSLGVGATAAAAVVGDTQLGSTPTILAFDALPTRSGLVVTAVTTFGTAQANISINEMATFNGTTNGTSTCFSRIAPIGPFTKTSALSISITYQLTAT